MTRVLHWVGEPSHVRDDEGFPKTPWSRQLRSIQSQLREEFELWMMLAAKADGLLEGRTADEEVDLFEGLSGDLSEDELGLARLLRRLGSRGGLRSTAPDLTLKELADQVRAETEALVAARRSAFDSAYDETNGSDGEDN